MRNMLAVARRVLMQFKHDPRTIGIMVIAPCLVIWLFSVLLGAGEYQPRIAVVDAPAALEESLEDQNVTLSETSFAHAQDALAAGEVDAVLSLEDKTLQVKVEGADASKTGAVLKQVQAAVVDMQKNNAEEA